ncbi:MAG: TIR domain-containing protein [Chloroflexota bacterium]
MSYRNKIYVAFDADEDIRYYRLMQAWKSHSGDKFNFHDAHDINNLMPTSSELTIKTKLRERLKNTKLFILLVGSKTRNLHKFVRWEIEQAIGLDIPITVVNLNGMREIDPEFCPPIIRNELAIHVSFHKSIIAYAMGNWPQRYHQSKINGEVGPYYYPESVYTNLGL